MNLLIRRGRLLEDPGRFTDLLIQNGRICAVGEEIPAEGTEILDADGLMMAPGLIDMHVHFREPGFEYKETIETGCAAAARGGVSTVASMVNPNPVLDSPDLGAWVQEKAAAACGVRVLPLAAVSKGQKGRELTDVPELIKAGVVALSDDGVPIQDGNLMRQALLHARGLPILSHCEDAGMVCNYAVNEGAVSKALGLPGRPAIAEEIMVMRDAMLAEETGGRVHICHVSTANSVEIVRRFKRRGTNITCETCPQYFTLTEEEVLRQGSMARVNPPLRTPKDVEAILAGLCDGTIDAIVTDHAPHSQEEKARPLAQAPSGMVGLETSLGLALTGLYHTGKMSLPQVLQTMTANPARILGLPQGRLEPGTPGDVVLFDPDEEWVVDPSQFASKGRNTPFGGFRLKGRVHATVAGGKILYRAETLLK